MHVSAGSFVTGTNVLVPISVSPTVSICKKINYPICNAMMDTHHEPHGMGSVFESGAGLSLPLVR